MFTIVRSPAKVCWHIMFNGRFFDTADTKRQAQELVDRYEEGYGRLL